MPGSRRGDHALQEPFKLTGAVDRRVEPAGQRAAGRLSGAGVGQDGADAGERCAELVGDGVDQIAAQPVGLFELRGQAGLFLDMRAVALVGVATGVPADEPPREGWRL
ncbi:hypothetical protein MXD62_25955 [Frankia sp. Mgl5]|nr:hypothetical protein [Frankia sp. Mgl5]MCK9930568.1 hypothetical protein [Frankia sp. Mgl5]